TFEGGVADHVTAAIDRVGHAGTAAQGAEIAHLTVLPEESVHLAVAPTGEADYLAGVVDRVRHGEIAAEGSQVVRLAVVPEDGVAAALSSKVKGDKEEGCPVPERRELADVLSAGGPAHCCAHHVAGIVHGVRGRSSLGGLQLNDREGRAGLEVAERCYPSAGL